MVTVNGSHGPVEAVYVPSPEYDAWNANVPPVFGVCGNVGAVRDTEASSATGVDVAARLARQVPLVNHENVTVPVGVGRPIGPVTVAWSCTVVPAGTDVTVACAASWITVTVLDATVVTVNGSHGPVEPVYVPSPEYDAWNAKLPDTLGRERERRARPPTPAASSVNGPDVAAAGRRRRCRW